MSFTKDFGLGVKSYGSAFSFIAKHGLWYFFLFPIAFGVAFYFLIWGGTVASFTSLTDGIESWAQAPVSDDMFFLWDWLLSGLKAAVDFLMGFLWILALLVAIIVYTKISKYLVLMAMSPVLGYMSEKVESIQTGNQFDFDFSQMIKDFIRGILLSLKNLCLELIFIFFLFLLSLIPVVGIIFTLLALVVGYYYAGFGMLDYSNERKRLGVKARSKSISSISGLAVGNGMLFELLLLIPILGIIISPVLAITAATLAYEQKVGFESQNDSGHH